MPTKDEIKAWLDQPGKSREWLAEKCGVEKSTVNNWLSTSINIPAKKLAMIAKFMREGDPEEPKEKPQNLVLEVDLPTFERWSRAALKHDEIVTEYAVRVIEEAAQKDMERKTINMPPQKYQSGDESLGTNLQQAAEKKAEHRPRDPAK